MKLALPAYVSIADGDEIVIEDSAAVARDPLTALGFAPSGDTRYSLSVVTDEEKARVFAQLREHGICFSAGREWCPCEVFEYLIEKKLLAAPFKEISWSSPGSWTVTERQ